jgi:large subunit ribosomal protein L3
MKKAVIAKKIGMTQIFAENGVLIPVTVLEAGPCVVTQKKTLENDGYEAVQVGFGRARVNKKTGEPRVTKPKKGHFDKAGVPCAKVLKELKLDDISGLNVGDEIRADAFSEGDRVDVSGITKGRGYQGAVKRHGQHRGPMSHGSKYHRHAGSLSSATTPGKVKKGKTLPGHMGSVKVTVSNLRVIRVDKERNLLLVKGAVPGANDGLLVVKESVKKEKK